MNTRERMTLEGMKGDIEHDVKQVLSCIANKGGLTVEAFIDRMQIRARDIGMILDGTYPWEPRE